VSHFIWYYRLQVQKIEKMQKLDRGKVFDGGNSILNAFGSDNDAIFYCALLMLRYHGQGKDNYCLFIYVTPDNECVIASLFKGIL
jgi:hypothetical protein